MRRPLTLRQIEAFKALVETGTVGKAAGMLGISQPGVSKLLVHLEEDAGLELFSRSPGKLSVTELGMILYREIDRVYASVGQIEQAVASLRRDEVSRLSVGVLPALSGSFIADMVEQFVQRRPQVLVSVVSRSSAVLSDWVLSKQIDLAVVAPPFDHTLVQTHEILKQNLVCIMPRGHSLSDKSVVEVDDLQSFGFIAFSAGSSTRLQLDNALQRRGVELRVVMEAANSATICELVARNIGLSLVHPAVVPHSQEAIVARPFEIATSSRFLLCYAKDARKKDLVSEFAGILFRQQRSDGVPCSPSNHT